MSALGSTATPWYRRALAWLRYRADLMALQQAMDADCPHDPLSPCNECEDKARAERW